MEEVWKDVLNYEGLYKVSNLGNIYSVRRKRKMNGTIDKDGYVRIALIKDGIRKDTTAHRLVAENFILNPNNYDQINHKDEIPSHNWMENLEWCNSKYNNNYGHRTENMANSHKKPILQLDLKGNILKEFNSAKEVQNLYNYDNSLISKCCQGKRKTAYGYKWLFLESEDINEDTL